MQEFIKENRELESFLEDTIKGFISKYPHIRNFDIETASISDEYDNVICVSIKIKTEL